MLITEEDLSLLNRNFNSWTVLALAGKDKSKKKIVLCRCVCGSLSCVRITVLFQEKSKACRRCSRIGIIINVTHGYCYTPEYRIWQAMKARINNPNSKFYHRYGGRGIKICDRWLESDGQGFLNFLEDMGTKPSEKHSIDRINNDGYYEPSNCRWATQVEQTNNTGRNKRLLYKGIERSISEWSRRLRCNPNTLTGRLKRGLTIEEALAIPIDKSKRRNIKKNIKKY